MGRSVLKAWMVCWLKLSNLWFPRLAETGQQKGAERK
jgi:hypothetical protein